MKEEVFIPEQLLYLVRMLKDPKVNVWAKDNYCAQLEKIRDFCNIEISNFKKKPNIEVKTSKKQ